MEIFKPWLLQTREERNLRLELYNECLASFPPIDEAIMINLKPPRTELDAKFELYIYQLRKRDKC